MAGNPFRSSLVPRVQALEQLRARITEELEAAKPVAAEDGQPSEAMIKEYAKAREATDFAQQVTFLCSLDLDVLLSVADSMEEERQVPSRRVDA